MWTTSEPVVREWIMRNTGPAGQIEGAARGVGEAAQMLARLPSLVQRAMHITDQIDAATRGGLSLAPETVAALAGGGERHRWWGTVALWVIAALLAFEVLVK
jgi:ubiquinone biosynthesis protein